MPTTFHLTFGLNKNQMSKFVICITIFKTINVSYLQIDIGWYNLKLHTNTWQ